MGRVRGSMSYHAGITEGNDYLGGSVGDRALVLAAYAWVQNPSYLFITYNGGDPNTYQSMDYNWR